MGPGKPGALGPWQGLLADLILPSADKSDNTADLPVQLNADVSEDGLSSSDLTYLRERISGPGGNGKKVAPPDLPGLA